MIKRNQNQISASGKGTIAAKYSAQMNLLQKLHNVFFINEKNIVLGEQTESCMSRWENYWKFTQATVKNLIFFAFMCVFECIFFSG